jgi:hypothetical protein
MRIAVLVLSASAGLSAVASTAWADCQARLDAMSPRVAQVSDDTQRQLLEHDVRHARKELAEGDERDCNKAMDHAAKLLDTH